MLAFGEVDQHLDVAGSLHDEILVPQDSEIFVFRLSCSDLMARPRSSLVIAGPFQGCSDEFMSRIQIQSSDAVHSFPRKVVTMVVARRGIVHGNRGELPLSSPSHAFPRALSVFFGAGASNVVHRAHLRGQLNCHVLHPLEITARLFPRSKI